MENCFERMSEETALELAKEFEGFANGMQDLTDYLNKFNKTFAQILVENVATRYLNLVEKYANASWITRWYWRRRLKRFNDYTLPELFDFCYNIDNTKNEEKK